MIRLTITSYSNDSLQCGLFVNKTVDNSFYKIAGGINNTRKKL